MAKASLEKEWKQAVEDAKHMEQREPTLVRRTGRIYASLGGAYVPLHGEWRERREMGTPGKRSKPNMLATTRTSSKGQFVIPEVVRNQMNLQPGIQFVVIGEEDAILLKAILPLDRMPLTSWSDRHTSKLMVVIYTPCKNC